MTKDEALALALDALEKIIQYNRNHARDQYGDAEKAERWSCVVKAREAITAIKQAQQAQEPGTFEKARERGVFKPALDCCPTWYATALRKEGWDAAMAAPKQAKPNQG